MQLHEEVRPNSWGSLIGQDSIRQRVDVLRKRGLGGRAFWISGPSGTGKTTIGRLLAHEIAEDWFIEERDAQQLGWQTLREMDQTMRLTALGKGGRAFIINEAHGLRVDAIRWLLISLEAMPSHALMVFTTTCEGHTAISKQSSDFGPLLSRCVVLETTVDVDAAALRLKGIAVANHLDGQPVQAYRELYESCDGNWRSALQRIESGAMLT